MGIAAPDGGFQTTNYFPLYSERFRDLPELVTAYIEAFAEMWPEIAGKDPTAARP